LLIICGATTIPYATNLFLFEKGRYGKHEKTNENVLWNTKKGIEMMNAWDSS
jgi:hypothetical protein